MALGGGRLLQAAAISLALLAALAPGGVQAADLDVMRAPSLPEGVSCESPEAKTFDSLWLGHFTGGYSHYLGEGGPIVVDWRDEKRCFATLPACRRYIGDMRRDFNRPEGYFTCLPIR